MASVFTLLNAAAGNVAASGESFWIEAGRDVAVHFVQSGSGATGSVHVEGSFDSTEWFSIYTSTNPSGLVVFSGSLFPANYIRGRMEGNGNSTRLVTAKMIQPNDDRIDTY